MEEGQLSWEVAKDKLVIILSYKKAGKDKSLTISNSDHLDPGLRENQRGPVEVSFERDDKTKMPHRIRRSGEAWTGPIPPPSSPIEETRDPAPPREEPKMTRAAKVAPEAQRPAGDFHNPYNFAPVLPRGQVQSGELGDHSPIGHDRYHAGHYSGRIRVRMIVKTPLLIPDAAEGATDRISRKTSRSDAVQTSSGDPTRDSSADPAHKHRSFIVRQDHLGRPLLPITTIKGALRNAYEIATNSRLSIFQGHDNRLARRMWPSEALGLRPARIEGDTIRLMSAAKLSLDHPAIRSLKHGDPASASVDLQKKKVIDIGPLHARERTVDGYVCLNGRNFDGKKYERFFYDPPGKRGQQIHLKPGELEKYREEWRKLIKNYQDAHASEIARKIPGPSALSHSVWSRHITGAGPGKQEEETRLVHGTLCYVRLKSGGKEVDGLFPVLISRELFEESPEELLLATDRLRPPERLEDCSPSERVFGWVGQRGAGSCRGSLRIDHVECSTPDAIERFDKNGVPLAILAAPKSQQAGFYAASSPSGEVSSGDERPRYATGQGLRGRKVYPHHRGLPDNYWKFDYATKDHTQASNDGPYHQEYRRPDLNVEGKVTSRDTQNRSIFGWVKPGVVFDFDIHVTNLSKVELGALLWLLRLPPDGEHKAYHRLGGGKPLGFGSVEMSIKGHDLRLGEDWAAYYGNGLDEPTGPRLAQIDASQIDELITAYRGEIERQYEGPFESVPFIAAFLRSCHGFEDGLPVHYPRISKKPNPEGESFAWFVANNSEDNGLRLTLPELADDRGLPINPTSSSISSRKRT